MATGYTGNVQECEEVWQEWHRALCAKCVELEEEKQLMSFTSKLECVYEFAYLGDMLNDTGGVEQAVATRVRAAWRAWWNIVYARGVFENERCCVYGMCLQRVDIRGRDLGDESRGFSEAACHR